MHTTNEFYFFRSYLAQWMRLHNNHFTSFFVLAQRTVSTLLCVSCVAKWTWNWGLHRAHDVRQHREIIHKNIFFKNIAFVILLPPAKCFNQANINCILIANTGKTLFSLSFLCPNWLFFTFKIYLAHSFDNQTKWNSVRFVILLSARSCSDL